MKGYFGNAFLVVLILILLCKESSGQTNQVLDSLLSINEARFIGKPLDSIIAILPTNYIRIKIYSGGSYYTARCLNILYPNEIWIDLHVRDFNYMNPRDTARVWNQTLMRKENLYDIAIYKGTRCYVGCDVH